MSQEFDPQERLEILRAVDLERHWYSLDEKRVCVICEKIISGREIEIRGSAENYTLHCPTEGCPANFSHWDLFRLPAGEGEFPFFPIKPGNSPFLAGEG
jgi:hypothetical protein